MLHKRYNVKTYSRNVVKSTVCSSWTRCVTVQTLVTRHGVTDRVLSFIITFSTSLEVPLDLDLPFDVDIHQHSVDPGRIHPGGLPIPVPILHMGSSLELGWAKHSGRP